MATRSLHGKESWGTDVFVTHGIDPTELPPLLLPCDSLMVRSLSPAPCRECFGVEKSGAQFYSQWCILFKMKTLRSSVSQHQGGWQMI